MKLSISFLLLFLTACSAGQQAANHGGDYEWIGCHIVFVNPSDCCGDKVYAFGFDGDRYIGEKIWWKQKSIDGKLGPVVTARPCKEGE